MNKLLLAVTDNQPRVLLKPVLTSILEGISKILPAGLIFGVFMAVYAIFSQPDAPVSPLRLWLIWGMLCILAVVQYLASYWAYNQCFVTAYENSATGRLALAERLRQLPLGFFAKRSEGELTTTLLDDFAMLEIAVSHFIPQFVGGITIPVIAFLFFLFIEWEMALAMFIALPLFIAVIIASRRMFARLADRHGRNKAAVSAKLQEYLDGIREIKAHNLGGDQFESLEKAFATQRDESIRSETLQSSVIMLIIAIFNIGLPVMIFTGVFLMARGELLLPVFLLFLLLGSRIFDTISIIMTNFVGIRIALSSARRIAAIRNELPLPGTLQAPETGYDIIFDRVSFSYGPQTPVLTEISLAIPAKKMTALVGPSGCGKTTITRLIARFWDVDHGQIRIGNIPVNEMAPQQVLGMLSVVFQDVYLFHDTIENNIRVGKMNATQEEIEEAARKACCHDFIMQLPGGYQTLVGEGGCTLSGGEKQRISIARALIKDAPIILLDEATASLDADNEVQVQKGINALVRDKTVVIIAHQLKTVQNAHQIIVLNEGAIVEQGRHKDLLGQNGLYAHLWELQQRTADWQLR